MTLSSVWAKTRSQLSQGRAIRDLLALLSGTMGARVLQVLTVPVIARLFDPADFGRVSLLVALAITVNQASSLGYEGAIVLPRQGHGARQVSRLALGVLAVFCIVLALVAWQWPERWQPVWLAEFPGWWWLLALMVAILGINNVLQAWALRRKSFGRIANSTLAQAGVTTTGRVGWGLVLTPGLTGLLTPYLAGLITRSVLLWQRQPRVDGPAPRPEADAADDPVSVVHAARRYAQFALFGLPSTLVRSVTQRLPLLLIGALFMPAAAGLYSAANRLLLTPAKAIGQAGRQVVVPRAAGRRRQGKALLRDLARATSAFAALALIPFAVLWQFGEPLMTAVLGPDWSEAGVYARPLAPWGYTIVVVGPTSAVFQALEQQRLMLVLSVVRLGLFVAAAFYALQVMAADPQTLIGCLALAGVAANVLQLILALWLAQRHDRSLPVPRGSS